MSDRTDISPWAHPTAQLWFESIFDRSGFLLELRDSVARNDPPLNLDQLRMVAAILILLGRPGVWPSNQFAVFRAVVESLLENHQNDSHDEDKVMTIEEHQRQVKTSTAFEQELEILRRMAGLSQRKSPVRQPTSWQGFWTG